MTIKLLTLLFLGTILSAPIDNPSEDIKDLDSKLNRLIIQNNAVEAEPFYMDDFVLITASGRWVTKKEFVEQIGSPDLKMEISETTEVKVRVHGTTAVLTGILIQKYSYKE